MNFQSVYITLFTSFYLLSEGQFIKLSAQIERFYIFQVFRKTNNFHLDYQLLKKIILLRFFFGFRPRNQNIFWVLMRFKDGLVC